MYFDPDITKAPRGVSLMLRHREWGVGIGSILIGGYDGRTWENVSFAGMTGRRFGDDPRVTSPSPVNVPDLIGWRAYPEPSPVSDNHDDLVLDIKHLDRVVAILLKAVEDARDRLAIIAEYTGPDAIAAEAFDVAALLNTALQEAQ